MAKLAEVFVIEYLNRRGYATVQGIKKGTSEWDLLAIRIKDGIPEAAHVEVQVSFDPVGYLSASSARKRSDEEVLIAMAGWYVKKFNSEKLKSIRKLFYDGPWKHQFVHGQIKDKRELTYLDSVGVELVPFNIILKELCGTRPQDLSFTAEGKDLVEIVRNVQRVF